MGKKARAWRAKVKRLARWYGVKEDELGRLHKTMTKREARERLVARAMWHREIEQELIASLMQEVTKEIQAIEDAKVFAELDKIIAGSTDESESVQAGPAV